MKAVLRVILLYIPLMPIIATGGWVLAWLMSDVEDANFFVWHMHYFLLTGEQRY